MLGKSTVPPKPDPKKLLYRSAPANCDWSLDKLMSGVEIISGLPTAGSYGILSNKQYYVYGIAAKKSGKEYVPSKMIDGDLIAALPLIIFIGCGGPGGDSNDDFFGTCGLSGSMDFHSTGNIIGVVPSDVAIFTDLAQYGTYAVQHCQVSDHDSSLWDIISRAQNGSRGIDAGGSSSLENGPDGPFRLLWSDMTRLAGNEGSSHGVCGGYGPGAGGAGANVGSWNGGPGAPGGVVMFFELK